MTDHPFTPEALRKAIQNTPPDQGGIGVVVTKDDAGISGSVNKSLGKGWSLTAVGSWMKEAGYSAAAYLGWTGRPKT